MMHVGSQHSSQLFHLEKSDEKGSAAARLGDRLHIPLWRALGRISYPDIAASQRGNFPHLIVAEREIEHV